MITARQVRESKPWADLVERISMEIYQEWVASQPSETDRREALHAKAQALGDIQWTMDQMIQHEDGQDLGTTNTAQLN